MIYVDTSVALAWLLGEDRHPPAEFWQEKLVSSRLIHYELWNRIHARAHGAAYAAGAADLLGRLILIELAPVVLLRAAEPFPLPVRTLDALHLATVLYLSGQGQRISIATYDERMLAAALALGIPAAPNIG